MLTHSKALWRIEYKTDLTRSDSEVLPLAFALEARWSNDVRWLGMLFRKRLEPLETGLVDLETWPELKDPENFLNGLFDKIWRVELLEDGKKPELGSAAIARNYSTYGSLAFVADDVSVKLSNEDPEESFTELYDRLLKLHGRLTPTVAAPVVTLPRKGKPTRAVPRRADVKQVVLAA
jgi:hypothetical protein